MSFVQTAVLGALAGFTIFLGLPVGRLQLLGSRPRVALAMFSVGVLAFIFVDVLSSGLSIVEDALQSVKDGHDSVPYLVLLVVLLGGGFAVGSAGLPTFLGSIVGYAVTSRPLELAFYAAAGGAILYVIGEVWNGMRRYGHRELGLLMLSAGFLVGVITDLVVTYGGA